MDPLVIGKQLRVAITDNERQWGGREKAKLTDKLSSSQEMQLRLEEPGRSLGVQ